MCQTCFLWNAAIFCGNMCAILAMTLPAPGKMWLICKRLRLQTVSTADLLTPAFELALHYDLTAYDACYAALAQQLSLPLITADAPLLRKLAGSGIDARTLI
ncbi:MAG: type II toxin-antitoxin system VapC family toxin [Chloroflexi bacterium]|nr:type II toxin-antitoxin system VapC family toxin [Chloroflexota bacterium]